MVDTISLEEDGNYRRETNAYLKDVNFLREDDNLQLIKFLLSTWRRKEIFFHSISMVTINHNLQLQYSRLNLQLNKFLLLVRLVEENYLL